MQNSAADLIMVERERRRRRPAAPPPSPDWRTWLTTHVPGYVAAPFAERHIAFWEWVASVQPNVRPAPFIAIWPRGGGKSTSAELATAYLLTTGMRRYAVYVSGSQAKADQHVESIGQVLERLGVSRAVNKYGSSRGWRRSRLRAQGFTIDAFGLDTGMRGAKDDEQRPDLIIFDDIDEVHDSAATTGRKVVTITQTLLPMGTDTAAILGVQNLIHADSVFAQLWDGRAAWLADREVSGPHPALLDCEITPYADDDGRQRYRVSGTPTWEGQDLAACQRSIDTIGPDAFEREAQQRVRSKVGRIYDVFDRARHLCRPFAIPDEWPRFLGLDFGGLNTVGVFFARNRETKKLVGYRIYAQPNQTGAEHGQALLKGEPGVPFCVGGSPSEGQWRRELRTGGIPVNEPDISEVEIGIDRVYGALRRDEVVFFDTLGPVIEQFETYRRPVGPSGEVLPGIHNKAAYHYCDAIRYIIGRLMRGI